MQLTDLFCCAVLAITVMTTCVQGDNQTEELADRRTDRRVSKRQATVLIDNYPAESNYRQKPKAIYRRLSRKRYAKPKPKYGPPRTKYGSPKNRKPQKKYRGKPISSYYGPPNYKKKTPQPKYGPPKPISKPVYGPPRKTLNYSYYPPEPVGFGEPPTDYIQDFDPPKPTYGEPPIDTYGAPLRTTIKDMYSTSQSYPETSNNFGNQDSYNQQYQSWQSFQQDQNIDNSYAHSNKHSTYAKPDFQEHHDSSAPDFNLNSYSDVYKYSQRTKSSNVYDESKPHYYNDNAKRPWKAPEMEAAEQIVVGGQYAEPPARYVTKFQPSAPMYTGDDKFSPYNSFVNSKVAASATISPYVNYKNSNMAFSPQNLNDAFSIVDK